MAEEKKAYTPPTAPASAGTDKSEKVGSKLEEGVREAEPMETVAEVVVEESSPGVKTIHSRTVTPLPTASPKVSTGEKVEKIKEKSPPAEMTSEEAKLSVAERKARISQALSRGLINDALADIDHPPDIRCVWIRETDEDIARRKMMGYEVETRYGEKFVDHARGDSIRRFGDTILMSCTMENFEMIEEVRQAQIKELKDAGKEEFLSKAARVSGVGVFDESEDLSPGSP